MKRFLGITAHYILNWEMNSAMLGCKRFKGRHTAENILHEYVDCITPIRVITKLPNSEQSYKGKVKTRNYINRQNQSTTGKL
jgi:hypothetical protein